MQVDPRLLAKRGEQISKMVREVVHLEARLAAVTKERDELKPKAELWQRIVDWVDVDELRYIGVPCANPDFGGHNFSLHYSLGFDFDKNEQYEEVVFGDTRDECVGKIEAATQQEDSDDE